MKRILVVDDEVLIGQGLVDLLRAAGYKAKCTESAEEAEEVMHFHKHPDSFDALITDFDMPGISGLELALRVRAQFPHVLIIIMSGRGKNLRISRENNFLTLEKPFGSKEVRSLLEEKLLSESDKGEIRRFWEVIFDR